MRIAHLSDLHFTTFFKKSNLGSIDYLLSYALDQKADHIIITGDLTDNADRNDFLTLRKLFDKHGLLNAEKLSLVIGNHDIFGGVQTAEDILSFPERCRSVDYKRRVREFHTYFRETFDGCTYISPDKVFPYAKSLNGILLIGMNSIAPYSAAKNTFASNGSIDLEQFGETISLLERFNENYRAKLVMIHHHFNKITGGGNNSPASFWQQIEKQTMKLRKKKRLFALFKQYGIDLVLHGHYHETAEYERKGVKFLNAGGSLKALTPKTLSINFIDIKNSGIKINTHYLPDKNVVTNSEAEVLLSEAVTSDGFTQNEIFSN